MPIADYVSERVYNGKRPIPASRLPRLRNWSQLDEPDTFYVSYARVRTIRPDGPADGIANGLYLYDRVILGNFYWLVPKPPGDWDC